jgi:hypothetical protein
MLGGGLGHSSSRVVLAFCIEYKSQRLTWLGKTAETQGGSVARHDADCR